MEHDFATAFIATSKNRVKLLYRKYKYLFRYLQRHLQLPLFLQCCSDMGAKKDAKSTSKTPAKTPKKKEGGGGGKAKQKKWSKGKTRDKLNNLVLFDKATYDKLLKEVPTYKLITPSIVSERLKVRGSLARLMPSTACNA